jgi:pimeloyl-ACP methyl ester carboxylesterase
VALAIGITALMIPVVSRLLGRNRPRFAYATGAMSEDVRAGLVEGGWQRSPLTAAPGVVLNGIVRRPSAKEAPWLLFFPGNDASQLATAKKFLEHVRGSRDWGLAVWAYRGFASSGGTPERDALVSDADEIYSHLIQSEHLDPGQVHVVAFSLGGYLAAHAVGVAARAGRKPASLSLLAAVQDIAMVRASWAQRVVPGDVYEILPLLDAVPGPVLAMIGTKDEAVGVEQGRKIAARLGARARYVEVPGVTHNPLLEQEEAFAEVRKMVDPNVP